MDLLGHFLRSKIHFRSRWRLLNHWIQRRRRNDHRTRTLPGGSRIICDMSIPYEAMVWLKEEEESDLNTLGSLLQPGQTFVDCGANIGLWTLVAAVLVGNSGKIVAFEPNPQTHAKLTRNVSTNHLDPYVQVFNAACAAKAARLPFSCSAEHNTSQVQLQPDEHTIMVEALTLDSILGRQVVHGIKLDIEGYELQALQGAQEILQRSSPWLCVEFNPRLSGVKQLGHWDVHQFLTTRGYECRIFNPICDGPPAPPLSPNWTCSSYTNLFYERKCPPNGAIYPQFRSQKPRRGRLTATSSGPASTKPGLISQGLSA